MASEEQRNRFIELAKKALELKKEAESHGNPEDARLGMQGAAAWANAYRVIFKEIQPEILKTTVWVYFYSTPESSFVDDVLNYSRSLENELNKMDSYRGYYGHI